MKHYTKKNKKSKLAKGFLCFLLALSPMMMNVSKAQAVEQNMGNYILDLEEGRLWAEDKRASNANNARKSIWINRRSIDYEKHEINWEIVYNVARENWNVYRPKISAFLPKTDLSKTRIERIREGEANPVTWDPIDDFPWEYLTGRSHKWGSSNINAYPNISAEENAAFNKDYDYHVRVSLENTLSGSNLNTWRDTGRIGRFISSNEGGTGKRITLLVTTYHDEDTALENVPFVATLANYSGYFLRTAAVGPFGIAAFHELKVPKRVYVDDVDNLTQNDKKRIFDTIRADIDKVIATKSGQDQINYKGEEDAAKVEIVDNTYVRTFSDGSKLKLGLRSFVRQRELFVKNQENVVNWKDSVDIALGVNDPEFKNEMIAMPAEGVLPAGLGWDEKAITTDVPNGKIRGIPDIDWSKVAGTPGEKEVTFNFNIALRKEDGTINKRPETYKPITITVKQDLGAVPVGVEDFPTTPFVILSIVSLGTIAIIFLRRRVQE